MRWIWIDKFVDFHSGQRAVAVKNVTLAEEHLHDHYAAWPIMPHSLIIEGMAQTAGILVGEARHFEEKVILAKIRRAVFHRLVRPGDQIRHEATVENLDEAAAMTAGRTTTADGELVAEIDLVFSHIDQNIQGLEFPEDNFVFTEQFKGLLRSYGVT